MKIHIKQSLNKKQEPKDDVICVANSKTGMRFNAHQDVITNMRVSSKDGIEIQTRTLGFINGDKLKTDSSKEASEKLPRAPKEFFDEHYTDYEIDFYKMKFDEKTGHGTYEMRIAFSDEGARYEMRITYKFMTPKAERELEEKKNKKKS